MCEVAPYLTGVIYSRELLELSPDSMVCTFCTLYNGQDGLSEVVLLELPSLVAVARDPSSGTF